MKKILRYLSVLVVAAAFQSCSTTYLASAPYDEVYDTRPAFSQTAVQPSQGQQSATPSASDNYPDRSQAEPDYRDYSAVQQQYSSGNQQTYSQEVVSNPTDRLPITTITPISITTITTITPIRFV